MSFVGYFIFCCLIIFIVALAKTTPARYPLSPPPIAEKYFRHEYYTDVIVDERGQFVALCPRECSYFNETLQLCDTTNANDVFNPECVDRWGNVPHRYNCKSFYICIFGGHSIKTYCSDGFRFDAERGDCVAGDCLNDDLYCTNCCHREQQQPQQQQQQQLRFDPIAALRAIDGNQ
nr:hp [Calliteara abietis nucleopolyhedrovirus]